MIYNSNSLTAGQITNLYLYGQLTKPADLSTLPTRSVDVYGGTNGDQLLSGFQTTVQVDALSFMTTGAGRFANGSMSKLVSDFMTGKIIPNNGVYQEIVLTGDNLAGQRRQFGFEQFNYNDSSNDIGGRTFIYASTPIALAQGAKFIVEADGTRRIENYALLPGDDNFDFFSSNFVVNQSDKFLKPAIVLNCM